MTNLNDAVKAALAKKKEQQGLGVKKNKADTSTGPIKSQVSGNKPAKKSAGRGR